MGPGFTKKTMRCDGNRMGLPDFFRFEGVRPQRKHAPSVIEWRGSHSSGPATVFTDLALYKGTVRPQEGPGRFADIGEGPDWVRLGKARGEHIESPLPRAADIGVDVAGGLRRAGIVRM